MGFRILIAVPTFESIDPDVFKAIYNLHIPGRIDKVDFDFVRGYDCAKARNDISQKAIDGDYDYVLMVDSDTVIPITRWPASSRPIQEPFSWGYTRVRTDRTRPSSSASRPPITRRLTATA